MAVSLPKIGEWQILREIGRGAMGVVYLAERGDGWEQVAIKVMHADMASNPEMVSRFFAEARAISRILHPNVVKLEAFGQEESGSCYLVMELLTGESLKSLVEHSGVMAIDRAVRIAAQIAEGLAAAHDGGVIHRDLKPENVFITQRNGAEMVKVLDFGLAKISGDSMAGVSHAGAVLGTPHYMAPEAARGSKSIDHRVDIYALGCILYELVTGSLLFPSAAFGEVLVRHVYDAPVAPSKLNPSVPPALERVILRALSKDPRHRFVSMTEMAWALRRPDSVAASTSLPSDVYSSFGNEETALAPPMLDAEAAPQVSSADPIPSIEVELLPPPLPSLDGLFPIAGEVTVMTPPDGIAQTTDYGHDAATTISAMPFLTFATPEGDTTAKTAPSPLAAPATLWDNVDETANVPPLVALQMIDEQHRINRARRIRRVLASAVCTFVVLGATLFALLKSSAPAVVAALPATVTVMLTSEPAGAQVFAEEQRIGTTPLTVTRARGAQLALRVQKDGYRPADAYVSLTSDQRISMRLEAEPRAVASKAGPESASTMSARGRKPKRPATRDAEPKVSGDELIRMQF